jgi:hypothetical protein
MLDFIFFSILLSCVLKYSKMIFSVKWDMVSYDVGGLHL